jgi:hypothetical protein
VKNGNIFVLSICKVPIEDTVNGIVAMNDLQRKADFMMEDIKKKETDLYKLNKVVEGAKMRFERTLISSDMLRMDMMKLEKQLTDLKQKEQMMEKTNKKLNIIQKRFNIILIIRS